MTVAEDFYGILRALDEEEIIHLRNYDNQRYGKPVEDDKSKQETGGEEH